MAYNTQYKIFVSSPGDVNEERQIVDDVVARINDAISDSVGIYLTVEKWEKKPPVTTDQELQERLNAIIKECHFFLLILYKRYGTIMSGQTVSNTEREINTIIDYLSKNQKKKILSYFKAIPRNEDPGAQETKILELKDKLRGNPQWFYKDFDTAKDFETKLTHDLYQILIRMTQSSFKVEQLKKFWQFGMLENQSSPRVLVVYPPVPREWANDSFNIWERRLLPSIYFEDYKALHKILKNLNKIGLKDYKVYSKFDTPPDFDKSNIIWICLPRQTKGLSTLRKKKDKRFDIIPPNAGKESYIRWMGTNGDWIEIKSPLLKYLKQQRKGSNAKGKWNRTLGDVIARDYAVIACFDRDVPYNENPEMDKLKEYYLTGIHGLGTWGAAWYIDRCYWVFKDYEPESLNTVQILVEVEYRDGKISNVTDVSDRPVEYFEEQWKLSTIKGIIKEYKEL